MNVSEAQSLIEDRLGSAALPCVTSSFQAECVVLLHLLRAVNPDIPVLFLDTVHHFPETYAYRDELAERWGLNLVTLRADVPAPGLWQDSTDGLLRAPQGRPALRRARPARRLVHRAPARAVAEPRVARRGRTIHAPGRSGPPESQPARQVDDERGVELREGARHSAAAALRPRLHEHRLRAVHDPSVRPVERTLGTMGRPEAGVRHPHPSNS